MSRRQSKTVNYNENSEDSGDYSVSEDDWEPNKKEVATDSSDDLDVTSVRDLLIDDSLIDNIKTKFGKIKKTKSRIKEQQEQHRPKKITKKALSLSLRTKLYNKYKPPPKVIKTIKDNSKSACTVSTTAVTTTTSKKKTIEDQSNSDDGDSDSSVENYLVDPNKIDFTSSFFSEVKATETTTTTTTTTPSRDNSSPKPSTSQQIVITSAINRANENVPIFDCNAGMQLSPEEDDGEEADDDEEEEEEEEDDDDDDNNNFMTIDDKITNNTELTDNKSRSTIENSNLTEFEEYTRKMDMTKKQLEKYKSNATNLSIATTADADPVVDISKLLAMGERSSESIVDEKNIRKRKISTSITPSKKSKRRQPQSQQQQQQPAQSDSDWEDVEEGKIKTPTTSHTENVEVTVRPSTFVQKKSRRELDFEACLRRQINAEKRTNQLLCHKVHLLCLIAHGNFINRILNNTELLAFTIKLLPSSNCYPNGETDVKYFESIAKWYKTRIGLKEQTTYCALKNLPPLAMSLGIQIKAKNAICKKDYLLIFIILLRAMGIQCRLLLNFAITPMRPPQSELFSFSDKSSSSSSTAATTSSATTVTSSTKTNETLSKVNDSEKKTLAEKSVQLKKIEPNNELNTPTTKGNEKMIKDESRKSATSALSNKLAKKEQQPTTSSKTLPIEKQVQKKMKIDNLSKSVNDDRQQKRQLPTNIINNKRISLESKNMVQSSPISHRTRKNVCKKIEKSTTKYDQNDQNLHGTDKTNKIPSKENIQKSNNNNNYHNLSPIHESPIFKNIKNNSKFRTSPISTRSKITQKLQLSSISKDASAEKDDIRKKNISGNVLPKRIQQTEQQQPQQQPNIPQMDGNDDVNSKKLLLRKSTKSKHSDHLNDESTSDDSDFQPSKPKKKVQTIINNNNNNKTMNKQNVNKKKLIDTRILSTDNEEATDKSKKKQGMDYWCEVYAEKEKRWITINLFTCKVDCVDDLRKSATQPMSYILAWNNDNTIKDVSPRYCPLWNTVVRTNRVDKKWFEECIRSYISRNKTERDLAEDKELNKIHLDKPLPTAISEFKNHPLYALKRHLLKFEAIYPENALTLGFIRGEAIYARECVHTLHSREIWVKQARVVRPKQKPYKIVKSRPKWDRLTNSMLKPEPLEIFGLWQTQRYEPPTAENGIVPRNAYGNVELFKPEMLPKKTVHLQLNGLNRTCKKMNIDCAQAVIGFDFHSGSSHPTFDGFVICEEFAERAVEQWWKDQEEAERRETEKYEQRVYGNWKKLIKGLLIRQRLQKKYNFTGEVDNKKSTFRMK